MLLKIFNTILEVGAGQAAALAVFVWFKPVN